MKLHKLTLSFLIITVILIGLHIHRMINYQTFARQNYAFAVSIAEEHPIFGSFKLITENENQEISVYENYKRDNVRWGAIYEYEFESFPLPHTLTCDWISIRERKIYRDTFELPHKKIDSLFKFEKSNMKEFREYNTPPVYGFNFGLGVEPGGYITVWLTGKYFFQKEIARYKAKEYHESDWTEYQKKTIKELSESFDSNSRITDSIIKNNIPAELEKWKTYKEKYQYYIQTLGFPEEVTSIDITFLNQERYQFPASNKHKNLVSTSVPNRIMINKTELEDRNSYTLGEKHISKFKAAKNNLTTGDTLIFIIEKRLNNRIIAFVSTTNTIKAEEEE